MLMILERNLLKHFEKKWSAMLHALSGMPFLLLVALK